MKSFRINIRWNPEYDQEVINKLKAYSNRNLSKVLRKIIREHLTYPDNASSALSDKKVDKINKNETVKWNFPK